MHPPLPTGGASLRLLLPLLLSFGGTLQAQLPAGEPVDAHQPGLALRQVILLQGELPAAGDGSTGFSFGAPAVIGEIRTFATDTPFNSDCPDAEGQSLEISSYTAAFQTLGSAFGGNGSSHFSLPDLRGCLALPAGAGDGVPEVTFAQRSGAETFTLPATSVPAHRHLVGGAATPIGGQGSSFPLGSPPALGLNYLINGQGEIRLFSGNFAPQGWIPAAGQELSMWEHFSLYDAIGTTYGGDGVSTFKVPDLRGRILIGAGTGTGLSPRALGESFGSPTSSLSTENLPAHHHTVAGYPDTSASGTTLPQGFAKSRPSAVVQFGIVSQGIYPSFGGNPFTVGERILGEVVTFAGPLPDDVLPADGRHLSIAQNTALFSLLLTQFGGNGQTTFALPDLRGRTPVGRGSGPGLSPHPLAQQLGEESHVLTAAELPPHQHNLPQTPVTFINPSFERDLGSYTLYPFYASDNGGFITGWGWTGKVGLNPGGGPFANNGATPDASRVAFLQSNFNEPAILSTTLFGLTPGHHYDVSFRANCRDYLGNLPSASWSLAGGSFVPFNVSSPVGGSNPYRTVTGTFHATADTAQIVIKNQTQVDSSLLVDHFTIARSDNGAWSVRPWTNNASTGVVPGTNHWLLSLGSTGYGSVNGVSLDYVPGNNPYYPGRFSSWSFASAASFDFNDLTFPGASSLGWSFVYGANPGSVTLEGLTAGTRYRATLFTVGYDLSGPRTVNLTTGHRQLLVNQNQYGRSKGMRIDYCFNATGFNHTIDFQPQAAGMTFHLYGLALSQDLAEISVEDAATTLGDPLPATLNLGAVAKLGSSAWRSCRIRNDGSQPLGLSSVSFFAGDSEDFQLQLPAGSLPRTLAPGEEFSCQVRFSPQSIGTRQTTLLINSNDANEPMLSYSLTGTGLTAYSDWTTEQFQADAANPAIAGPDADPDGDGMVNKIEYALRSDPKTAGLPGFGYASGSDAAGQCAGTALHLPLSPLRLGSHLHPATQRHARDLAGSVALHTSHRQQHPSHRSKRQRGYRHPNGHHHHQQPQLVRKDELLALEGRVRTPRRAGFRALPNGTQSRVISSQPDASCFG